MNTWRKVGCCLVAAIAAFGAWAEVKWTWNGTHLTEIVSDADVAAGAVPWKFALNGAGVLSKISKQPEGTNSEIDLRDETLPEGAIITKLSDSVFEGNQTAVIIRLPETLRIVGTRAFRDCAKLRSIVPLYPTAVTNVGATTVLKSSGSIILSGEAKVGFATDADGNPIKTTLGERPFAKSNVMIIRFGPGIYGFENLIFNNGGSPAMVDFGCNLKSITEKITGPTLTNVIIRTTGDFTIGPGVFYNHTGLIEVKTSAWLDYTPGTTAATGPFYKMTGLQCRFVVPWDNAKWNALIADPGQLTPWADCSSADKATYFNRYGQDAIWPVGISTAVANGIPRSYIVRNQEPGAGAYQLRLGSSNPDMVTLQVDHEPDPLTDLYAAGSSVKVTAVLQAGAEIVRWEGPGAEAYGQDTEITVTMDARKRLTAIVGVQPKVVEGSLAVAFPKGDSQAQLSFTMGGQEGAVYDATAVLYWKTNGTDWVACRTLSGLTNGQSVAAWLTPPFSTGSTLDVKVAVTAAEAGVFERTLTGIPVENPFPSGWGRGGGAGVYHVWSQATGDESGSDWSNAALQLPPKMSDLPEGVTEVWIANGDWLGGSATIDFSGSPVRFIRGGFAGTECSIDERVPDAVTTIDGNYEKNGLAFKNAQTPLMIERMRFTRAKVRALYCGLAGARLDLVGCQFVSNAPNSGLEYTDGGRVIKLDGNTASVFSCSNCIFRDNAARVLGQRAAVHVSTLKRAEFLDCSFVNNGVAWDAPTGGQYKGGKVYAGFALCVNDAPTVLTRCEFRANRGITRMDNENYMSGIVVLHNNNATWSCGVTNCLFVGNEVTSTGEGVSTSLTDGVLTIHDKKGAAAADIVKCTFAYNILNTDAGSAGLTVKYGSARVRNCIFHGNRVHPGTDTGADVYATKSGASIDIDYSIVSSLERAGMWAVTGAAVAPGEHMKTDDPLFVTRPDRVNELIQSADTAPYYAQEAASFAAVEAFDVHVRRRSPAIDTGDPESDYSKEPKPNGRCVNLGAYGNTPWATMSPGGGVLFVK